MKTLENINLAITAIRSNLLRSFITMSIISVGILALVGILTALDVFLYTLENEFSDMGANSFNIERKYENIRGNRRGKRAKASDPISYDQAMKFKDRFNFPKAMSSVSLDCSGLATLKYENEKTNPNVSLIAGDLEYIRMKGYTLDAGRMFSESEIENGLHKILLGAEISKILFGEKPERAIGKTIMCVDRSNVKYRVVGVFEARGASMTSNEDRAVIIPITNAVRYYNKPDRTNYNLSIGVSDAVEMNAAESEAIGIFRNIRRLKAGQDNDFRIFKSDGIMEILKDNTVTIRWATIFIGLATLCGAAIGLMNIMLVSVTERTREIGVCKALGASSRNVLIQFLTEAIVISVVGGIIGIILGMSIGLAVAHFLDGIFVVPWNWMALGFGLCFLVGVVSGFYPALRASKLDPIEALRYE